MTIGEAIQAVRELKPDPISRAQLVRWLEEVDLTIFREIVKTHWFGEDLVFDPYDPEGESGADSVELLAPAPYSRMYVYYLAAAIDRQNQEYDLYQNNAALFNEAYLDYANYYNRQIPPRPGPRFGAWATPKRCRGARPPGGCGGKEEGGVPPCCCQS